MSDRTDQLLEAILAALMRLQPTIQPARPESITIEQAAEELGCSRARIFELFKEGTLRRAKRIGRRAMVLAASVAEAKRMPELPARQKRPKQSRPRIIERAGERVSGIGDSIRAIKV